MKLTAFLKSMVSPGRAAPTKGATPQDANQPKPSALKKDGVSSAAFMLTAKNGDTLKSTDDLAYQRELSSFRYEGSTQKVLRKFVQNSPDLSAAVTAYVRTALTNKRTVVARDLDGTPNREATAATLRFLNGMDSVNDYTLGFDSDPSLRSLCETWAWEIITEGAMMGEVVLDAARLPRTLTAIAVSTITFKADKRRIVPFQVSSGKETSLDFPTVFMVSLDQSAVDPLPTSPIKQAISGILFSADFMDDIRRVVKRAIHPRVVVTIDEEKFLKSMPEEYRHDEDKMIAYRDATISNLQAQMDGLRPEDAVVLFDSVGIDVVDHGYTNLADEYKSIREMADAQVSAGAKVLPTVIGRGSSTSNTASAEVLLFLKSVEGTVWCKLNEMLSKMLTLVVRLHGYDCYVDFSWARIELRPESEIEAFKAMEQSRVLDLLSLGLITDEDASLTLTSRLPPEGAPKLSGTGFRATAQTSPAGSGYNGATNDGSTLNQKLKPDTPTAAKGKAK